MRRNKGPGLFLLSAVLLTGTAFFGVSAVQAGDSTSTSFNLRQPALNIFGGISTSTSFDQLLSGGILATGKSTSTNFIIQAGLLPIDPSTLRAQNWRWYGDETNATPTSALSAENTAPSNIAGLDVVKLRITVRELAGVATSSVKFKLQFSVNSNFASGVTDVAATSTCVAADLWCYANGGGEDNGGIATKVLSDADSCPGSSGDGCGTHNENGTSTSSFTHKGGAATEYEFTIKNAGARVNTTYFFRLYRNMNATSVSLGTGETYPSLSIEGPTLTFTVGGLGAGVTTEGVTTDAISTSTTLPFGSLAVGVPTEIAHRLTMTTNATEGYQLFVFQTQGLLKSDNSEVLGVSGTNASPAVWAIPGSQSGAFGYHAGDDTLSGGSTRFASDNTYAALETTAREIAHSSGPVSSESTDLVFKVEITNQQESGYYSGALGYIAVPTF